MAVQHYFFWVLEWYDPKEGIEVVEDVWTRENFEKVGHETDFPPVLADRYRRSLVRSESKGGGESSWFG